MTSLPEIAVSADTRSSAGVLEPLAGVSYYGSPRPSRPSELDVDTTPKVPEPLGKCLHCSAPVQSFLCWNCGKMLRRVLADVPWLLRRLAESAYGEAKVARKGGPRVSTGERLPSLPLNSRAADLIRDAARLVRWSEQVAGADCEGPTTPDACEGAARYLGSEVGRMMQHPYSPDALRWSLQWREDATKAVDLPPDTTYAGPCQAPRTEDVTEGGVVVRTLLVGGTCGAALYVDAEALVADCFRCGTSWRVEDLQREALARVDDRPRTAADMWRLFKFLGREVPRSSFYQLMTTVEAHDVSGEYPTYTYTAVARALDDRDAAEAKRRAEGKAKRGRPRKPKSVDAPTVTVDGSTGVVLPSAPSVSDTG
ncbi:hypothetical protein SEA_AMOHNITION_71 [Mycobacterium phage Amohnition]|uniref:Uncharacterized protein n=1 Tax=Mycobacterium phage Amohnition TaxID=2015874 RepID=A0A222ZQD7_9CAUD|nr:hypothetical protein I5G85_gp28 [Mycobacterium phage Amohnition]ASR86351.1 hypothetical protein SEA_AMOHNITION_71 [Mycobacterium phage Amohnition]